MKVIALVENTPSDPQFKSVHGLSFYIETALHKILFDLGPDDTLFKNAAASGIDLKEIDTVIISHGHDDHGGALKKFMELNTKATVYLRESAFQNQYVKVLAFKTYIGLDQSLKTSERIIFTDETMKIDKELFIVSNIQGDKYRPTGNKSLYTVDADGFHPDKFVHEQNLVLSVNGKLSLFAGCAHCGIVNILERTEDVLGCHLDYVFSGFHLYNPALKKTESKELIHSVAKELGKRDTIFYTCHCTGQKAYKQLHEELGDKVRYISAGMQLSLK